ncbi:MAG: arginine--tRNA ligase [Thermodesulfobacteriota bacterium]|nr:arginine--tRNA ligase [Thermodesulfobacteriota bacterium]
MKETLKVIVSQAVQNAHSAGALPSAEVPEIEIEYPKVKAHGDFATNIAMVSAAAQKMAPRAIADAILSHITDKDGIIEKTEVAGPGFINFFINRQAWLPVLHRIHSEDERFGASNIGRGRRIQVEFVSANPTGPLHVGHGRGAAVGDAVANILAFCAWQVEREYYVNDAGNQIMTLGRSVYLRMRQLGGDVVEFPSDCYQGDYIQDLARRIMEDPEAAMDSMDEAAAIQYCARYAADTILTGIREDLAGFGVTFDSWFSEKSLFETNAVEAALAFLKEKGDAYEADGALWFAASTFGDEKDRVVVRNNGETTYFASDIAYHKNKLDRGFERLVDVWGADHHGYIPRVRAAIKSIGEDKNALDIILVQLVNLLRRGKPAAMSTRAGEFVTLREVADEVGTDAARFIFLTRHYDSPLDFDLELAKEKTNDNPVYYVQYVHARIASILRKAAETRGITDVSADDQQLLSALDEPEDIDLIKALARYPEVVAMAAECMEPHRITFYLMELAGAFHSYYNKHKVLVDDRGQTMARLYLVCAVKKVIRNGLALLGVSAPESM